MLQKWKFILSNWINCYFNNTQTEECITVNTLLTITSHLHKNLNLDESKSSKLEAQNIKEFILEKYPQFKFENGKVEPSNEEELYMVASLLLFFVCVNSKDVDIKQAMCSRLSPEDQETIMKFSKSLMDCSPVTLSDVQAAIKEACGQDTASGEKAPGAGPSVAETPPVLRSLHGEVRRLQAALDAEHFDRNYLQEELARTNLRMEKLLKEKEQFKLEIVDLKAKISMCWGLEAEAQGSEAANENAARMTKQLHDMEERLVATQGQLDDAQYERDSYKAKMEELKKERNKWLTVSQEETSRASLLADELEAERRRVISLQEIVAELRQHHKNNRLDASQLECDDPDASIHSLHNASVCSEACANVIEVQLGEERAKVDILKHQILCLQTQLSTLTQKVESEKLAFEYIITEKDNGISDLKHRINEEIYEKNNLKAHFNDIVSKLNKDINDLEQKLQENSDHSRSTIELKMRDIQILQEEKLSLLQCLSDESTKLESVIKNLKTDIDTEKNLKVKLREDYENQMMKLNEKVLNRNNELVELQNKVFEKGEMLENLHMELKKEKELNYELSNKHNDEITKFNNELCTLEQKLLQKSEEAKELQRRLFQNVAVFGEMNREIDELKAANENLVMKCEVLEQTKESLLAEIQQRDDDVEGIRKEIENITNIFSEEKNKFMHNLEERNTTISALQVRLHEEIQYKIALEKELQQLHQAKAQLNEEVMKLSNDLSKSKADISEKDRMIYALELYMKEERHINLTLKDNIEKLNEELVKLSEAISAKNSEVSVLEELTNNNLRFEEEIRKLNGNLELTNDKLLCEMEEKEALQLLLMSVNEEKEIINKDLIDRCSELERLQEEYDKLCNASEQNIKVIEALENKIDKETKKYLQLEIDYDTQTSQLIAKLSETEKSVKDISSKSRLKMEEKELQIQSLKNEVDSLNKAIESDRELLETTVKEKEVLYQNLEEEISFKNNIEKAYQNQCAILDNISSQLNGEIAFKSTEIKSLKSELESLRYKANEKNEELRVMETKLIQDNKALGELEYLKNQEIKQLKSKIDELHALNDEFEQELKKEIASKTQAIEALQKENEQLQFTIEEDNSNHEIIIKEKDVMIEGLEEHVKVLTISLESLRKDYENGTFTWEKMKIEMQEKLEAKDSDIIKLKEQIDELKKCLEHVKVASEQVRDEIKHKNKIIKEKLEHGNKMQQQIESQVAEIYQYENKVTELKHSNETLKLQLVHKEAAKDFISKERDELHNRNVYLLEELHKKKTGFHTLEQEKKALAKEKSILTNQLKEKKSERLLIEQELQTLLKAKQIIERNLAEKNEKESALLEERELLITEINRLSQQVTSLEEEKVALIAEKDITVQQLSKKQTEIEYILETKDKLLKENQNILQQLEVIALVKHAHLSEKQMMEEELLKKDSVLADLLKEKEQLSIKMDNLSQRFSSAETVNQNLLAEKRAMEQQLIEKETSTKALLVEKEHLLVEKESLEQYLESGDQVKKTLLAEKQIVEQQLVAKEGTVKVLSQDKEQLSIENRNLSEQLQTTWQEKQVLLLDKESITQQLIGNEVILKALVEEKESFQSEYENIVQQFKSLSAQKQAVEQRLAEETANTNKILVEKESISQQFEVIKREKESLSKQLTEAITARSEILVERQILLQKLEEENTNKVAIEQEKQILLEEKRNLEQQLEVIKTTVEHEKQKLMIEMRALEEKITEETTSKLELSDVKEYLLKQLEFIEKEKLDLIIEKEDTDRSLRDQMEQLKQKLYKEQAERQTLHQQITEELAAKNMLLEVKEYLSGQLIEEKATKELLENEKEMLQENLNSLDQKLIEVLHHKSKLEEERNDLFLENNKLNEARNQDIVNFDKQIGENKREVIKLKDLLKEVTSSKDRLNEEKQSLLSDISSLNHSISDLNAVNKILAQDKELLVDEKEELVQSLNMEKASRDELECEKNAASITLQEINEKYALEIKEKQEYIANVSTELKQVQMDFKKHEDVSVHIAAIVNKGLDKFLQDIEREKLTNDVLQTLINIKQIENVPLNEKCKLLVNIANTLPTELVVRYNLEKTLELKNCAVKELKDMINEKENQAIKLQTEMKSLQKAVQESQSELTKQTEIYNTTLESKVKDIQNLQLENKSLNNELNDVKVKLDVKVHSLKEKLIDNENLTDKLKKTYECQIENLNMMVTKLTSYLKEKTNELDVVRKEKEKLQQIIEDNNKVIKSLEEEVKTLKATQEKQITDFESERQVMKNMVTLTESVMEDQKVGLNNMIADYEKTLESYRNEKKILEQLVETAQRKGEELVQEKQYAFDAVFAELTELRKEKEDTVSQLKSNIETLNKEITLLKDELMPQKSVAELMEVQNKLLKKEKDQFEKTMEIEKEILQKEIERLNKICNEKVVLVESLQAQNEEISVVVKKLKEELLCLREKDTELEINKDSLESELLNRIEKFTKVLSADTSKNDKFKYNLQEKLSVKKTVQEKIRVLTDEVIDLIKEKNEYISKLDEAKAEAEANEIKAKAEIEKWKLDFDRQANVIEENQAVILNLEQLVNRELNQAAQLRQNNASERLNYENRCALLQEYQTKAEKQLLDRDKEINYLKDRIKTEINFDEVIENLKEEIVNKDTLIAQIAEGKDEVINTLSNELMNEKATREKYQQELESKSALVYELKQQLVDVKNQVGVLDALDKKNDEMIKTVGQRETFAVTSRDQTSSNKLTEKDLQDRHQVSTPTSDLTHSSMESFKTINDLEKIIHDKNRTITTLQSDITYLKSLIAESENKLLDVNKERELFKENCEQLSSQLKKLVYQKNEEIADLKKQISKMSVTENRATQIIKVSAKYQAIILKRIAEIKSNTILKELTNFGNTANCDSDLKRNLNSGAITMEDLENFLETTDRHLKRCSEKQLTLQKERDRLTEVNRINESEIINMKKFLTELAVSFKTFNSIKDLYTQKLSRVVSMQRTVRREIFNLDGQVTDSVMCKLERGYAAVMQDLCECAMNLERWVERSIARTISAEKIKQAFTSDTERASLASTSFQNASLEVQLEELENSFQKILEDVVRAQKGEGARDVQAVTVMEVRAEYEDKLNRMKAKMKQLYLDQIQIFKNKQKEEIMNLERELQNTRDEMAKSSRAYEDHIKKLTTELWTVGEKFLMKKDEADWLRKKQKSGSLMSLQHLHSTGLMTNHEELPPRPSDTQSLRSLPVVAGAAREGEKREGRGLQMSDEEGEVFDNRWLKELHTPRRESNAGQRLSELRWRNSLCPPHLKSSYPAETQFTNTLDEEDIKCAGAPSLGGRVQRKEVGIIAYKKPGPPTPSKQAGRLSATDSELRESGRVEGEPSARRTGTPSRLRALFRGKPDPTLPESEYPKCDTECKKCDSETRKNDWFKLNLRERAALWEPLAKN